jgi:hypothetical protein
MARDVTSRFFQLAAELFGGILDAIRIHTFLQEG